MEHIRDWFKKARVEFRQLHGPNNVLIVSFEDIDKLLEGAPVSSYHSCIPRS